MNAKEAKERLEKRIHVLSEKHELQYHQIIKEMQQCIDKTQTYTTNFTFYYHEDIDISVLNKLKEDGYEINVTSQFHRNESTYKITFSF